LKGARASSYTAGLIQAEELWAAAASVSPVASPILRYYAVVQASLAVCAASVLGNQQWKPARSHGLTLEFGEGRPTSLDQIRVKESAGHGTAQVLAAALGSPLLAQPTSVVELIAALPEQSLL